MDGRAAADDDRHHADRTFRGASRVRRMKVNGKTSQQSDKFKAGRRAKRMSEYFGYCLLFPLLHF